MAQIALHSLNIIAVLQGKDSIGVPLWHNKDKSENPCGARATPHKDNNKITVQSKPNGQQSSRLLPVCCSWYT